MQMRKFTHWRLILLFLCIDSCVFAAQPQQTNTQIEMISPDSNTTVKVESSKKEKFKLLNEKMQKLASMSHRNWDEYEQGARDLIKQFPDQPEGYQYLMVEIEYGPHTKVRALAKTMLDSSTPEQFKSLAKGFIYRLDSIGKPVTMQFVALDGREVDLAKMNGKMVLIVFWGIDCAPSVAALSEIKTAYDKYHAQGFEVIGISFDSDKARLVRFIKDKQYPWPQYFEDKQGVDNKYAQEFGIYTIPQMLLVDKKGCLRLGPYPTGPLIETCITNLLAEP